MKRLLIYFLISLSPISQEGFSQNKIIEKAEAWIDKQNRMSSSPSTHSKMSTNLSVRSNERCINQILYWMPISVNLPLKNMVCDNIDWNYDDYQENDGNCYLVSAQEENLILKIKTEVKDGIPNSNIFGAISVYDKEEKFFLSINLSSELELLLKKHHTYYIFITPLPKENLGADFNQSYLGNGVDIECIMNVQLSSEKYHSVFSKNKNYIHTRTLTSSDINSFIDQLEYFDGLGRPNQTIQIGITPTKKDLVSLQEYDNLGRESESWLSTVHSSDGAYTDPTIIKKTAKSTSMYNDENPYAKLSYEASPLNRIVEQYGPGQDWHSKGKSVKTYYLTNKGSTQTISAHQDFTEEHNDLLSGVYPSCQSISLKPGFQFKSTEEKSLHLYTDPSLCQTPKAMAMSATITSIPVLRDEFLTCSNYEIINQQLTKNNSYKAGELYVTLIVDEDDNQSLEFKDKLGQVVLTRQINGTEKYDTYYVYDDFGNLRYVLPPMAVDKLTKYADNDPIMKQFAYIYKYDNRNRCVWKKLPGVEHILYVYDKADRLIFSQDGEQRTKGEWTFSIPDAFGRVVLSGVCKTVNKAAITTGRFDNWLIKAELPLGANGIHWGYDVKVGQSTFDTLSIESPIFYSANYYDNYNFKKLAEVSSKSLNFDTTKGTDYNKRYGSDSSPSEAKGLLTGSIVAQFDGGATNYLYSIMYYDNRGRVIQTQSTNHLPGGKESEFIAYNFISQPIKKLHVHLATGKSTQTELYTYTYDHAGRLIDTKHKLNADAETLIAHNEYDELGRLKTNKKGNNANLSTAYTYNIRSWPTSMKSYHLHFNLDYTYGANIKTQSWTQGGKTRKYDFAYDNLSRLTVANYTGIGTEKYNTSYTYDKHGNMMTLQRGGLVSGTTFNTVDNLSLSYVGNQLNNVHDTGTKVNLSTSTDFKDYSVDATKTKKEYSYNANGAMTQDLNKGITTIQYNSLNLPMMMDIKSPVGEARNEYTYSASGQKLRVIQKWNPNYSTTPIIGSGINVSALTVSLTTDYVGNKVYENGNLKRILIDGGYIEGGKYHYYLTDHLGNNRAVAEASGTIIQQTQYYPFGMAFAESTGGEKQPYKYNNKELDMKHGLNMYDYAARQTMPDLGNRFTSIDPLAEKYYSISPYAYVGNNPLKFIDPTGMFIDDYYNLKGEYLYTDGLQSDNIRIIDQSDWDKLMYLYPGHNTTASYRDFDQDLYNSSRAIDETQLTAEAYSNIFTKVLSEMDGVDMNSILNGKVSVSVTEKTIDPVSKFNNPYIGRGNAYTGDVEGKIRITASVSVYPETDHDNRNLFSSTSNIQNLLGVHEYIGHGIKGWSDKTNTHYKAYDLQMAHPTWGATTPAFRNEMKANAVQYNHQRSRK